MLLHTNNCNCKYKSGEITDWFVRIIINDIINLKPNIPQFIKLSVHHKPIIDVETKFPIYKNDSQYKLYLLFWIAWWLKSALEKLMGVAVYSD